MKLKWFMGVVIVVLIGGMLVFLRGGNVAGETTAKSEVIGFLPSWSVANGIKVPQDRYTQIIYFGLGVNPDGDLIVQDENGQPVLEWIYFKKALLDNPKMVLAIKLFDNETIDRLIGHPEAIDRFTSQLLRILKKYDLAGVNIDFEYVTGDDYGTAKNFNNFLKTLTTGLKPQYFVSVDITNDPAYDLKTIGETVDQIIFMAYDSRQANSMAQIQTSIQTLLKKIPAEKIILGIPLYNSSENEQSIAEKIKYTQEQKLGGVAFWAIGYENGIINLTNYLTDF